MPELFRRSQNINVLVDSSKFFKLWTFQISPLKPSFTIFSDKGRLWPRASSLIKKETSLIHTVYYRLWERFSTAIYALWHIHINVVSHARACLMKS